MKGPAPYGLVAMFGNADDLLSAARRVREAGYRHVEAFSPFPVEGLAEILGEPRNRVPYFVLAGAVLGAAVGYAMQWYASVVDYPINVGGRPLHSWPAFLLVTFELAVLCGALAGFFGMLVQNGLPRLHHPLFGDSRFGLATRDRFFLCIESSDPRYEAGETRALLESCASADVAEVPVAAPPEGPP